MPRMTSTRAHLKRDQLHVSSNIIIRYRGYRRHIEFTMSQQYT
jgi:hypothetical protein